MHGNYLACDAVLFDLDGVLIDSTACITRHWRQWADQHGLDLDTIMQAAHGVRTIETIRLVAPNLDAEREEARFTAHEVDDTEGVYAIEGARRLVAALPDDAWTIVTSGGSALARARLRAVGLPIPGALVTGDDVARGKPAPDPYQIGAARLGVPVERCIVIEDAPAGIHSGTAAGMRVVGIASTHSRAELLDAGADVVVKSLTDLAIRPMASGSALMVQLA
jgi:mannitol-1-/sugar-/sorbitol-6-phosphatase